MIRRGPSGGAGGVMSASWPCFGSSRMADHPWAEQLPTPGRGPGARTRVRPPAAAGRSRGVEQRPRPVARVRRVHPGRLVGAATARVRGWTAGAAPAGCGTSLREVRLEPETRNSRGRDGAAAPGSAERGTSATPAVAAPGRGLAHQLDVSSPPAWLPGIGLVPSGLWNGPARGARPSRHTPASSTRWTARFCSSRPPDRRVPRCPTDRRGGDDELLRVRGAASGRSTTCRGDGRGGISGGGRRIGPMRTLGPRTNADERNLLAELNAATDDDGGPSTGYSFSGSARAEISLKGQGFGAAPEVGSADALGS